MLVNRDDFLTVEKEMGSTSTSETFFRFKGLERVDAEVEGKA